MIFKTFDISTSCMIQTCLTCWTSVATSTLTSIAVDTICASATIQTRITVTFINICIEILLNQNQLFCYSQQMILLKVYLNCILPWLFTSCVIQTCLASCASVATSKLTSITLTSSVQLPPFKQGLLLHSSIFVQKY